MAKTIQLGIQYSPEPPFIVGLPHEAGPEITRNMTGLLGGIIGEGRKIARSVRGHPRGSKRDGRRDDGRPLRSAKRK